MAKNARFKRNRPSQSSGEKQLELLLSEMFPAAEIYTEYPYSKILAKGYKFQGMPKEIQSPYLMATARKLHADFFLPDLGIIIEYNGEFHYDPIDMGSGDPWANLEHRKHLDKMKRLIATEAEYRLIEIPYTENLTKDNVERMLDV